jgi:hypothetical protein
LLAGTRRALFFPVTIAPVSLSPLSLLSPLTPSVSPLPVTIVPPKNKFLVFLGASSNCDVKHPIIVSKLLNLSLVFLLFFLQTFISQEDLPCQLAVQLRSMDVPKPVRSKQCLRRKKNLNKASTP